MHELASQYETARAIKRVVLLGASNLSRGFPTVVRSAQQLFGSPLEIMVAKGYGRSYGQESSFFGKKVCGILQSDLWAHLERNNRAQTCALITDVGNDILYGVPVETILQWVAESIDRLHQRGAQVVMTDLPVGPIRRLGKVRFLLFRALLFPACGLTLEAVRARAEALSRAMRLLAKNKKVAIFKVKNQWYGLDPIHVRRSVAAATWTEILGFLTDLADTPTGNVSATCSLFRTHNFQLATSSFWSVVKSSQRPIIRLRDGTTIAQY